MILFLNNYWPKEGAKFHFTSLAADAHQLRLQVHPYAFRANALDEFSSTEEMIDVLLYEAEADGGFTDFSGYNAGTS